MKTETDYLLIDTLGDIQAQIKRLTAQADLIKAELKANGAGRYEGLTYGATVYESAGRVSIDWETIAAKFNPSRQLIAAHTTQGAPVLSIKLTKI